MKGNKRSAVILALAALATLASCGGTSNSSAPTGEDYTLDENWKGKITWWHTYLAPTEEGQEGNFALYNYAKGIVEEFQKANPNITVELVFKGSKQNDYAGLAQAVSAGLPTRDLPNIASTYGTYVYAWAQEGVVADVSAHAAKLREDKDFSSAYLDSELKQYGNKYYSLPYSKSTDALMLNAEIMKAKAGEAAGTQTEKYLAPVAGPNKTEYTAPATFEDLMATARKIKEDYPDIYTGKNSENLFDAVPVIYEDAANLLITLLESKGIPFVTNDSDPVKALKFIDSQDAKDLVVQLAKYNREGLLATKGQLRKSGQWNAYPSDLFAEGRCYAIMASTTGAPWMAGDGYSVSWNALPKYDSSSKAKALSQGPSLTFFDKKDKNEVAASLLFYDFLTKKENTAKLAADTNYFPLRASAYEDASLKSLSDAAKVAINADSDYNAKKSNYGGKVFDINKIYEEGDYYFMSPVFTLSDKARTACNNIINAVFDDVSATTDEAIKTLVDSQFTAAKTYILG